LLGAARASTLTLLRGRLRSLAACLAVVLLSPAYASNPRSRGEPWDGQEAVVRVSHAPGTLCSGVFVRPDIVLTAAHCVLDARDPRLRVARGTTDAPVLRALVHPRFPIGSRVAPDPHDVALLLVSGRPPGASRKATLALADHAPGRGEPLRFVGYGGSQGSGRNHLLVRHDVYRPDPGRSPSGAEDVIATGFLRVGLLYVEHSADRTGASAYPIRGDSGGPVLDRAGRIVGVIVAVSDLDHVSRPHHVTWAVSVTGGPAHAFVRDGIEHLSAPKMAWRTRRLLGPLPWS